MFLAHTRRHAIGAAGLFALVMGSLAADGRAILAQEKKAETKPTVVPLNRLEGIVVAKADGSPIAGVRVAMASLDGGWISFGNRGEIEATGPEETVLFFFTKRNGKAAVSAVTDDAGRFVLKSFRDPQSRYALAAAHEKRGAHLAVIAPAKHMHAAKPLRIELDRPASIDLESVPVSRSDALDVQSIWNVELVAPESAGRSSKPNGVASMVFLDWSVLYASRDSDVPRCLGPLPPGWGYSIVHRRYDRDLPYSATLFESRITLKPGMTAKAGVAPGDTTVSGRIMGTDGQPLRGVNVMLRRKEAPFVTLGAITGKDGRYTIAGAAAGRHEIELLRHAVRTGPG